MSTAAQERPRDRYDQEVERLAGASDRELFEAWQYGRNHSPLFDTCNEDRSDLGPCGCLTQVRAGVLSAATKALTKAIRRDARIPAREMEIRPALLPVFAEWQRRIDQELGRTPPPMLPEPAP